jgi:hypothetical protein
MTERQFSEIERVLLAIGDAAARTERAVSAMVRDQAEPHVVEALRDAHARLSHAYRGLAQGTYYAIGPDRRAVVPDENLQSAD